MTVLQMLLKAMTGIKVEESLQEIRVLPGSAGGAISKDLV